MKKVVFFGCNGYLGSHLVEYLKSKEYHVFGYDVHDFSESKTLDTYYKFDVSNINELENIDFDVDYVYYFSGITGTHISLDNFDEFIDINEKGLLNLLTVIRKRKVFPKIIFPSTRLVYKGCRDKALTENDEKEFKTIYALNKFHNENCLKLFNGYYNIPFTVFRIGVPYGNTLSHKYSYGTIGFFLSQSSNNKPITLYGDGNLKRTFTFVQDVCRQIVKVSESNKSVGQTYNVGGETFSLKEIAVLIASKYNVDVKYTDWPELALAIESGDTIFDSSKIEKITGFNEFSLKDWIINL